MANGANEQTNSGRAKSRLTDMLTQQVGIVDRAANKRTFLMQKNEGGMAGQKEPTKKDDAGAGADPMAVQDAAPPPPPPPGDAGPITLPTAAKQALSEGLAAILTQASDVATKIQNATIDDSAPVPPELLACIDQMSDSLDALSDGFDPEMAMALSAKSFGDNYKPDANAGGGDGSATPQATTPNVGDNYIEKGAGAGAPPGDVKPPAQGSAPPMPRKTRKLIAKGRMSKIEGAYAKLDEGHQMLKAVMTELKGEGSAPPNAPVPPIPAKPGAVTEKSDRTLSIAPIHLDTGALAKLLEPLVATVKSQGDQLNAFAKASGASRAAPNDGGQAPPPAKKDAFRGGDFNRQLEEEEREERERAKAGK